MRVFATLLLLAVAGSISAAPVKWSLTNVQFDDGAVATGSFVFDADTNQTSQVSITVSGGTTDISGYGTLSADPFT